MSILSGSPNQRQIIDANFSNSTALGTAGSTVQSAAFDLGDSSDGINPTQIQLNVIVPATPSLTNGAALTFTVLNDGSATPTTATPLTFSVTGTAGGGPATTKIFKLAVNMARYLSVQALSGTSGAGNNSAVSFTTQLAF